MYIYIYIYNDSKSVRRQLLCFSPPFRFSASFSVRSISEISSCFFGPRPWHIEIRHRVKKQHPQLICSDLRLSNWKFEDWNYGKRRYVSKQLMMTITISSNTTTYNNNNSNHKKQQVFQCMSQYTYTHIYIYNYTSYIVLYYIIWYYIIL